MSDRKRRFLHETFARHARELAAFVHGRWPGEPEAADIVQEAFLRLSQYPEPEAIRDPRAFLFQTASNLAVDLHRRRVIRDRHAAPDVEAEAIADAAACPERQCDSLAALERFTAILDGLPEIRRHAFILFRFEGLSHREIGTRLGISPRSSERHVMEALREIARQLGPLEP